MPLSENPSRGENIVSQFPPRVRRESVDVSQARPPRCRRYEPRSRLHRRPRERLLSRYHATARIETETTDVQLAGRAEDAAYIHQPSVETIADELGVVILEYELLEIDKQRG